MPTVTEAAEAILVAHQRRDLGSCLCGWSELGKSHPGHQVAMLREAELLGRAPSAEPTGFITLDVSTEPGAEFLKLLRKLVRDRGIGGASA